MKHYDIFDTTFLEDFMNYNSILNALNNAPYNALYDLMNKHNDSYNTLYSNTHLFIFAPSESIMHKSTCRTTN